MEQGVDSVMLKNGVINHAPTYKFDYQRTNTAVFHVNKGEGLVRHEHDFAHITYCVAGRVLVTKENVKAELDKDSLPVLLTANEWHQIEALEDGTIFINIFPLG